MSDLTLAQAKALHKKRYKPLSVEKLEGPRFEIVRGSSDYPDSLTEIDHPPAVIYGIGNKEALAQRGLAIIGARRATPYGQSAAYEFASEAAAQGVVVISGGALGCDAQAHRGSLAASGKTVVVLGGGCDQLYPEANRNLFQEVINNHGAVISERHWDFPPLPYTFRARNRIIAGLARAVLIVEAGLPSGTFSTADDALAINRDVWAVPGSISSPTSAGANRLIYQGATPIIDKEVFADNVAALFGTLKIQDFSRETLLADEVLEALYANPMRLEELLTYEWSSKNNQDTLPWVMTKIAQFEQAGLVERYPDGRYGPAHSV